ncbi:L-threonylcarbamoyladenylate synthase [Leucobacter japonicus]|uniref:L-threonylcarbamoyladenylate synthase n=1 Tax=Leucobacter japonicus TaxID=1461259 RepID=UPI0006A77C37
MTRVQWNGDVQPEAIDLLGAGGNIVVCPTKVGYIILTSDRASLDRKFAVKQRALNKPGVVLCGSMDQLRALAEITPEIEEFYQRHWDQDILMGCILPWREEGRAILPDDGTADRVMDGRGTSCFVIRFGIPGERIVAARWADGNGLTFASSANPSGKGNRGVVAGIGDAIATEADLIIEADDYVRSIQPDATLETRYEQGVMVSFVDAEGALVPEQHGERSVTPAPVMIRKGLDIDRIMMNLSDVFPSWDYRHGEYY